MKVIVPLDPIAVLTHDGAPQSPLCSWPPVPAEDLHQGEQLALRTFGELLQGIKSPRHLYFTAWRDPSFYRPDTESDQPPGKILLVAQFGIAPYETSNSLVELADMYNRLDRASLRLDLVREDDGGYRPEALTFEMNDPASETGRLFRSCWQGEEVRNLGLTLNIVAPATRRDPFRFHVHGRLPRRYNRGDKIEPELVEFTASGGAMPLPSWVNY